MKKRTLALILALLSFNAVAEWTHISTNQEMLTYVDLATKRKAGNKVKLWVMYDFKNKQHYSDGTYYYSMKSQEEYDCYDELSRILSITTYTGKQGTGKVANTYSSRYEEWKPIAPETLGATQLYVACK